MDKLTVEQQEELEAALRQDGYSSIEGWMLDSDYHSTEDGWYDEAGNGPYDPWIQFFWAKDAEGYYE